MGKRLVALSLCAALVAWPALSQEDSPDTTVQDDVPPVAEQPVPAVPDETDPVAEAPEPDDPAAAEPAETSQATDPVVDASPVEEDPAIDPILPIGDEPLADLEPARTPDPDNSIGTCRESTVYIRGDFGKARFAVDVADTQAERSRGLMHVESMPTSKGMLFVYPAPQPVAFWMKNTLIPLDMIFADSHGVVVKVHDRAVPGDLSSIPGGDDVQFVLEINGGLSEMLGIGVGAQLRHPAIRRAAWPC